MKKWILILGLMLMAPISALALSLNDDTWNIVYDGYGTVNLGDANQVELQPMTSTQPGETHAALVLNDKPITGNYKVNFTVENVAQLRQGSDPNPWEAPWFIFGYKPGTGGITDADRTFSYLIFKPDGYGLELGEALPFNGQNFLWTSPVGADSYPVGQSYQVEVIIQDGMVTVNVDGIQKFIFSDLSRKQLTSDGYVGLYSEDAKVKFSNLQVSPLITEESAPAPTKEKKTRTRHSRR